MKCEVCKKCRYVSLREAKGKRREMMGILSELSIKLKNIDGYVGFSPIIVGSAKRNMIIQKGEELFDTDIQATFNAKKAENWSVEFKQLFFDELKKLLPDNYKAHLSSSVITINMSMNQEKFHSFDIAIIRGVNKTEINRGKSLDKSSQYYFSWNESKNINEAYKKFRKLKNKKHADKINDIKQRYLNRKCENRGKDKDMDDYRTSSQLFVESVNEVV